MLDNSKDKMENEITEAIADWEFKGQGFTEAKTDILRNLVIVFMKGVLSPAEHHFSLNLEGMTMIKELRRQLVEQGRPFLEDIIKQVTSASVISMHTDISTKTGELLLVFVLDREI